MTADLFQPYRVRSFAYAETGICCDAGVVVTVTLLDNK